MNCMEPSGWQPGWQRVSTCYATVNSFNPNGNVFDYLERGQKLVGHAKIHIKLEQKLNNVSITQEGRAKTWKNRYPNYQQMS